MDDDRKTGTAKKVTGKIKEVAGKLTGNERLEAEGKAEQVAGDVHSTVGKGKDTVRDAIKK